MSPLNSDNTDVAQDGKASPSRRDSAVRLPSGAAPEALAPDTPGSPDGSSRVRPGDRTVVPPPRSRPPASSSPTDATGEVTRADTAAPPSEDGPRRTLRSLADALGLARQAAEVAEAVSATEEAIATTLQSLDGDPAAVRRRQALAAEATRGAREAQRRCAHLRRLASQSADQMQRAKLWDLAREAESALRDYARTEDRIAAVLTEAGPRGRSDRDPDHDPTRARAAARAARGRAAALHRLAESTHASAWPAAPDDPRH